GRWQFDITDTDHGLLQPLGLPLQPQLLTDTEWQHVSESLNTARAEDKDGPPDVTNREYDPNTNPAGPNDMPDPQQDPSTAVDGPVNDAPASKPRVAPGPETTSPA